jgi:hypothetical protein
LYFRQCIFGGLLLYSSVVKPQIAWNSTHFLPPRPYKLQRKWM